MAWWLGIRTCHIEVFPQQLQASLIPIDGIFLISVTTCSISMMSLTTILIQALGVPHMRTELSRTEQFRLTGIVLYSSLLF
jgi:hypothetical protein